MHNDIIYVIMSFHFFYHIIIKNTNISNFHYYNYYNNYFIFFIFFFKNHKINQNEFYSISAQKNFRIV